MPESRPEAAAMKRSEINAIIQNAMSFLQVMRFHLPPFAFYTPAEWKARGESVREIVDLKLGWDVTDFGSGDFRKTGLLLFTLRNGKPDSAQYPKPYAEKILIIEEEQRTPLHFHWNKMEDIINRGGGNLVMELYHSTPDEGLENTDVRVAVDGVPRSLKAGGRIVLSPGESICLPRGLYHSFYAEKSGGGVLAGEVSAVNDDERDNRFFGDVGRFSEIDEDAEPAHLLCSDYGRFLS
jgi:D-lyxose ketol-isomerase